MLPDGQKDILGGADQVIGQLPGDLLVRQALVDRVVDEVVILPAGNKVGHDDGIGGGPGGADGPVAPHQVGIDRVEPELGAGGN